VAPITQPGDQPGTTVPSGVPLPVALERRAAIERVERTDPGTVGDLVYVLRPDGPSARTPPREFRAQFDALVLSDGSRLSLSTSLSAGTAHPMRFGKPLKKGEARKLFAMLPYHRQAWQAATLLNGVL
jgi:hypothetical protein